MTPSLDVSAVRSRFPALADGYAFLENAGGSQMPDSVIEAIVRHFRESFVQLGAGYPASDRATQTVADAHTWMTEFMGGTGAGHAVLGASTSALTQMLANMMALSLEPGDEVVVAANGHEANVGPWMRLDRRGLVPKLWPADPVTGECTIDTLEPLLTARTRVVAACHVSNLLGSIMDLKPVVDRAHAVGARVVADGVAFAPHRAVDVQAIGADWYAFSNYKVFGPHMATLFGTHEAIAAIDGPNHFFVPRDGSAYKFELGGANHEGCAGLLGMKPYLNFLLGRDSASPVDHAAVRAAFGVMEALEAPLVERLVGWLLAHPRVRIVGPQHAETSRVSTISFVVEGQRSASVSAAVNARGLGIRSGHMYSYRLCQALGIDVEDGVVRASMAHYNTMEEIERLIEVLEEAFA